ncbi:calcium-binding protein [Paracoccus sp. PAMC 22219]|uniref:calcium-binding protein n=1 Tax=Paracoccus sp. PAMC 22219 TaxID=1569209 RepID=UPI000699136C|nr:calcium-binding protein [Paracoccus sp. PAMC 22219]
MADLKANYALDMLSTDVWYGYVTVANSTTIRVENGGLAGTYRGSFWYDNYGNPQGRLDGYDVSYYGTTWVSATRINRDVATFQSFIDRDDAWGAQAYVFSGSDKLTGSYEDDTLVGFAGDDFLYGGNGFNILFGGDGNDTFLSGADDAFLGDAGSDRVIYDVRTNVTVNLNLTSFQSTGHGQDSFKEIEHLTSGSGNDRLTGNSAANSFSAGGGNDMLNGGNGNDSLYGEAGNDTLEGGSGNDLLNGGFGNDTVRFTAGTAVSVNLSQAAAQNTGAGLDTIRNVENALTGAGNDRIIGSAGANSLTAGSGNDVLSGLAGNDRLFGQTGNDRLQGGAGNDILTGGIGADRFLFSRGDGNDRITDFANGIDRIVIDSGAETFGHVRIADLGADARVSFGDVTITLSNFDHTQLGAEDFIFT